MALRLVALLFFAIAACGRTSQPVEIPADDLPFAVTRTDSPIDTAAAGRSYAVYFVRAEKLAEHSREFGTGTRSVASLLRLLLEGPSAEERAGGISTQIPREVRLLGVVIGDGAARVDLSGEFQEPAPPVGIALRVAQVVWTLTALPDVQSVSFSIDGEPVAVTTDDLAAVERPVTRADYAKLAPAT